MDTERTISATEARANFAELLDNVENLGAHYTLTVNGKPKVTILSAEEFESLQETVEILSDPVLMKRIVEGEKAVARGDMVPLTELVADEAL